MTAPPDALRAPARSLSSPPQPSSPSSSSSSSRSSSPLRTSSSASWSPRTPPASSSPTAGSRAASAAPRASTSSRSRGASPRSCFILLQNAVVLALARVLWSMTDAAILGSTYFLACVVAGAFAAPSCAAARVRRRIRLRAPRHSSRRLRAAPPRHRRLRRCLAGCVRRLRPRCVFLGGVALRCLPPILDPSSLRLVEARSSRTAAPRASPPASPTTASSHSATR